MKTDETQNTSEIICPSCNKAFKVDETAYSAILKQVRNSEFEKDAQNIRLQAIKEKEYALQLAASQAQKILQEQVTSNEALIAEEKAKANLALSEQVRRSESQIGQLKAYINQSDLESKLAVDQAVHQIEKERDELSNNLKSAVHERQILKSTLEQQMSTALQNKDAIIKHKDEEIERIKDMKLKMSTKMLGETLEQHCEIEFNKMRPSAFRNAYCL